MNYTIIVSLSVLLTLSPFLIHPLSAETFEIIKPIKIPFSNEKSQAEIIKDYEPRKGYIQFSSNILYPETKMKVNDTIKMTFFHDTTYEVLVESITYNQNGTISISGRIKDAEFSTVLITLSWEGFVVYLKDLKKNHEYHATGSVQNEMGIIKEINVAKTPSRIHLPPKNLYE